MLGAPRARELQHIVNEDRNSDNGLKGVRRATTKRNAYGLSGLEAVDASVDVDRVCAEDGNKGHVEVVDNA